MSVLIDLARRVAEIIPRYNMLSEGGRVGVAVSGGADSVALLHVLWALSGAFKVTLTILHVNHHLRGAESNADEQLVRDLGAKLGLLVLVDHALIGSGNLEQEAREARRRFFLRTMHDEQKVSRVALGHTRSDQAETVLFRLLRGSGLPGLAAMHPRTPEGFIRPLLETTRQEVREWLAAQGYSWREDSSNEEMRFTRNRIRLQTMPELARDYNENLEAVLAGTAQLALAEEDYWQGIIPPLFTSLARRTHLGWVLDCSELEKLHLAVRRRLIRDVLFHVRGTLRGMDMFHVERILAITRTPHGHDRVLIPGADVIRSYHRLLFAIPGEMSREERHYVLNLSPGERVELPYAAGSICLDRVNFGSQNCANFEEDQQSGAEVAYLDGDRIAAREDSALQVRNWQPGDQLHRTGHRGAEKIKTLFQEYRVPLWLRRHWPVLVLGQNIVWARQFGCAHDIEPTAKSSKVFRITYKPAEPA